MPSKSAAGTYLGCFCQVISFRSLLLFMVQIGLFRQKQCGSTNAPLSVWLGPLLAVPRFLAGSRCVE
jgi:hypothetical protein